MEINILIEASHERVELYKESISLGIKDLWNKET